MAGESDRFGPLLAPLREWIETLGPDLAAAVADGRVWAALVSLIAVVPLVAGLGWVADRAVQLAPPDAGYGERLAVRLASGLTIAASLIALVMSTGRSSYSVIALSFLALVGWVLAVSLPRQRALVRPPSLRAAAAMAVALVTCVAAMALLALLYVTTVAPSPRDGVQPVEFSDHAYYALLGAQLAETGVEDVYATSGLDEVGEAEQAWYHWGELWLAAALVRGFALDPMAARHVVVLPAVVVTAALLAGSLVSLLLRTSSRRAFVLGAVASLILAPLPTHLGTYFSSIARGTIASVTTYGLALVVGLLACYLLVTLTGSGTRRALSAGVVVATLAPTHLAIAVVALAAFAGWASARLVAGMIAGRRIRPPRALVEMSVVAAIVTVMTVVASYASGHTLAGLTPRSASPFGLRWAESVSFLVLASGVFLLLPFAWTMSRRLNSMLTDAIAILAGMFALGAIAWGYRIADFNTFHLFLGPIATFSAPIGVAGVLFIVERLRESGLRAFATAITTVLAGQLAFGAFSTVSRLEDLGPEPEPPTPTAILAIIRDLPPDAKIAYACDMHDELTIWDPYLLSLALHGRRPVIPMCFQADVTRAFYGLPFNSDVVNPFFVDAPQRSLYPTAEARPSTESVLAFMDRNGIDYVYETPRRPNTLVPNAVPVADVDGFRLLSADGT